MREKNENGSQSQDGWYKHKDTGAIVHLVDDSTFGVPLTNAYVKAGFEFVSKEDPREVAPQEPKEESKVSKKEGK